MRIAYIYSEADVQGPWIPLCEACIRADAWQYDDVDAIEYMSDDEAGSCRCACCGQDGG